MIVLEIATSRQSGIRNDKQRYFLSMRITNIQTREIFDSRGEPTIEVLLSAEGRVFSAQIPSGKSRGSGEAVVFKPEEAAQSARGIAKKLVKKNFKNIRALDSVLLDIDGSSAKAKIGGNVALGISIGFARALAFGKKKEVWRLVREEFFEKIKKDEPPLIFANLINGGAHAKTNTDIQEYMVVLDPKGDPTRAIGKLIFFYRELGAILNRRASVGGAVLGDEGGYALNFRNNFEPIEILSGLIKKLRLERQAFVAMDAAASGFFRGNRYRFDELALTREELTRIYRNYFRRGELLLSVEDPFHEGDHEGFRELRKSLPKVLVAGDDLTVTDADNVRRFAKEGLINAVIIKPNQAGTITETCEAIRAAEENNIKFLVSHRSAETEDNFILQLAKASGAYGVKIGAPARERLLKYNEFMRLYS